MTLREALKDVTLVLDAMLSDATVQATVLEAERDRYHAALEQIANHEAGVWGTIAHNALREPEECEHP